MDVELINNVNNCYQLAETKALSYFQSIFEQVMVKSYVPILTNDIQVWKKQHITRFALRSLYSKKRGKPVSQGYYPYLKWLDYTGKLDPYLYRSISYIFMRDLGKALDSTETQTKIRRAVDHLKKHLTQSHNKEDESVAFSMARFYRWGQKEGIESTIIWMMEKLKTVSANIPEGMDYEQAQRKLIKIIAGVMMHVIEEMGDEVSIEERAKKLGEAIKLGYSYGLTYPFIDDLLDSKVLSEEEQRRYSNLIRTTLLSGAVPELGDWPGKNRNLMQYIHSELSEAFRYIKAHQQQDTLKIFLDQSYVFFHSQEIDRIKDLSNPNYTNEEIYIPIILKSSSSRLIVRSVISAGVDEGFENRTFFYGIYNQLADDFADMYDDLKNGAVTPYTYYMKYHKKRCDLINPFELYWTVISNLIHTVYHSDSKTCEVILDRAINGLKRFKERMGIEKYNEVMDLFASGNPEFNKMIQKMVGKAENVDFFDKLLRDHMNSTLKKERREQEEFKKTIDTVRKKINHRLKISKFEESLMEDPIIDAANYSLEGDGKRLRPIMTWVMGIQEYGLNEKAILPLLKSLEYMHTASLIFDDLPSQDNASIRRGRPTLHMVSNIATAELTGLFLTQKAIEEQASLHQFDVKKVLQLIQYSTQVTEIMCTGQAMDLNSKGKLLNLEQLNTMCFFKTGIGFEASLIMPAILANRKESEIAALKKFARHAGIAFQIKDDLLDIEGESSILGKQLGKDIENNNSTFVSILGKENAKKEMWEHYCNAMEVLQNLQNRTAFLKHLLNYIVNRDH